MTPQPKPSAAAIKAASCFTPSDSPEEHLHANAAVIDAEFNALMLSAQAVVDFHSGREILLGDVLALRAEDFLTLRASLDRIRDGVGSKLSTVPKV